MKTVLVTLAGVLGAVSTAGYAVPARSGGIGSSGGGFAVVCRSPQGAISSIQLLDLYEARLKGAQLRPTQQTVDNEYKLYVNSLRASANDTRPATENDVAQFHTDFDLHFVLAPEGTDIGSTDDLGTKPNVPAGCKIEQAAVYRDNENTVYVKSDLWNAMNAQNKVALFAHETLYLLMRQAGDHTSQIARKLVPLFFQNQKPVSQTAGVPANSPDCYAGVAAGGTKFDTHFFYYASGANSTTLQFDNLLGRYTFSPTKVVAPIKMDPTKIGLSSSGKIVYSVVTDPNANSVLKLPVQGGPFQGFQVVLYYQYKKPLTVSLLSPEGAEITHHTASVCRPTNHNRAGSALIEDNFTADFEQLATSNTDQLIASAPEQIKSVRVVKDLNFGFIKPSAPAACSNKAESMVITVEGQPGRTFSVKALGSPYLLTGDGVSDNTRIAITDVKVAPQGRLDANGKASVTVSMCRAATSANQKAGLYELKMFNVQFQYL